MLTNRQIKSRELFKASQSLIKVNGNFKKAQHDLLCAFNECALSEYRKDNKLKKSVVSMKCKSAIKYYFSVFADKVALEEQIQRLRAWQPAEEEGDKR